jgi:hypothetical protein
MTNSKELEVVVKEKAVLTQRGFQKKIKDEWMPSVMEWASQGISLAKMCVKFQDKFGTSITPTGLSNAIRKVKVDRSSISKAVVVENVGSYIINDLEGIKSTKLELFQLKADFKEKKDWKNYFSTVDRIKELSKMIFDLGGVNENQVINEAENAKQDLLDMFEKFQFSTSKELNDE